MATGLFNLKQVNQAISQGAWSGYIAPKWVEYLVVAGGGGGGSDLNGQAGGGGAGGLLTGIVTVAPNTSYTVTVGAGGAGGLAATDSTAGGTSGQNSVFGSIATTGGGGGGAYRTGANPKSGGSGGGASQSGSGIVGAQGVSGQGNAGSALGNANAGGGGGGAGTIGLISVATVGGSGGAGIASSISGTVTTYAGGGGGGAGDSTNAGTSGAGGVGGGGSGGYVASSTNYAATSGSANAGGGGGGGANYTSYSPKYSGGSGGSGIVVVRYPGSIQFFTGGTLSYANGYMIHTFYANGTLAPTTPTPYVTDYQISRSLRFNSADSAYLNRTPASSGNQQKFTFSYWFKRGAISAQQVMFGLNSAGNEIFTIAFLSGDTLRVFGRNGGTDVLNLTTTAVYRDPSAWYHIVVAIDTTQATSSNRALMYVNGVQVTAFGTATYPAQNTNLAWNSSSYSHQIGREDTGNYSSGYQTETNFIDGQALTPSSFGYTDPDTGVWSPLAFVGTYGTNGFYLNFSDNSNTTAATLGKDYSGNGNNWTPNNFSVTAGAGNDSLVDSPTSYGTDTGVGGEVRGNYATWNPLSNGNTLANGNLQLTGISATWGTSIATIGMSSGKWYCEATVTSISGTLYARAGIATQAVNINSYLGVNAGGWGYISNSGNKENNTSSVAYGSSWTSNDVIGIAFDADAGTLTFYKNNVSQGTAYTGLTSGPYFFAFSINDPSVMFINFGQRPFAYTAPSGYKALCTQNLPTPTIGATSTTLAGKYFNPVLYTGNGGTQSVTGVGFQPDFTWVKSRTTTNGNGFEDAVRGAGQTLESNNTSAEVGYSAYFTAFTSDGFNMALGGGFFNSNGQNYVAWNWKANGSGSTNTAGSITSTVSANTTSGFSVVTYTGNGTANATFGHGLGVQPSFVIIKSRSSGTQEWRVWAKAYNGGNGYGILNLTSAFTVDDGTLWGSYPTYTGPTSSVVTVSSFAGVNGSGATFVAYCFAEVAGYSKFGSYDGNGSTDGPFVYTGFRPAYILAKSSSNIGSWVIYDAVRNTYNVVGRALYADLTDTEYDTPPRVDFLSNGFKLRSTGEPNNSGRTFIYMVFAQNPFKYSLAR